MDINEYQQWTESTAIYPKDSSLPYVALGLTGEAGEIANKVKKIIRDDAGQLTFERKHDLVNELGDVMWYVARMATELGVSMSAVLLINQSKLNSRLQEGTIKGSGDNR
jgi:NTP pyrophosphatase (non-canonical NTP hydrolase)